MTTQVFKAIESIVHYGINNGMIDSRDKIYARHRLMALLTIDNFKSVTIDEEIDLLASLDTLLNFAYEQGIMEKNTITHRDIFDSKIMDCIMRNPSTIDTLFFEKYKKSPMHATDWFYNLNKQSNYIRENRIKKNVEWTVASDYGPIGITINLSKPEKDPEAIEAAKNQQDTNYPKCYLCKENEGYYGRLDHPGRSNHRIIPLTLNNEDWFFQYSPYSYYNEHCIVFKASHDEMQITGETYQRLTDFVTQFPSYFIGSNADLPIVGGSILSHDHFQGGNNSFGIEEAEVLYTYESKKYDTVDIELLKWPLSVIRLRSDNQEELTQLAWEINQQWIDYSDEALDIIDATQGVRHNTVTPISRMNNNSYEIDLVLRNNRRTEDYPLGIFHPHADVHHIKKENIGLIEVMGLAILPARLKEELEIIAEILINNQPITDAVEAHEQWINHLKSSYNFTNYDETMALLREEVGRIFVNVLEYAGVYKMNSQGIEGFKRFLDNCNLTMN